MAYTIIYRPKPPNYYAGKSAEGLDAWSEDRNFAYKIRTFWEELDLLAKLRADGSPLAVPISCND